MKKLINDKTPLSWFSLSKKPKGFDLLFDNKFVEKLMKLCQPGNCFYCIHHFETNLIKHTSPCITEMLSYSVADFNSKDILLYCHPEDIAFLSGCRNALTEFYSNLPFEKVQKYKSQYDFRIRKSNGDYIRLLVQVVPIHMTAEGKITHLLTTYTDISHIKTSNVPSLSFIGLNENETSYKDVQVVKNETAPQNSLSKREKEILQKIVRGNTSREIAENMYISLMTVKTHRRNILRKTECNSTAGLIKMAMEMGWA